MLEDEYRKLVASLGKIGLSDYESRALVDQIAKNHGAAEGGSLPWPDSGL